MHWVGLKSLGCDFHWVKSIGVSFTFLSLTKTLQKFILDKVIELDNRHLEEGEKNNYDKVESVVPVSRISFQNCWIIISVHVAVVQRGDQAIYCECYKCVPGD